jgi:hypothetical protein
MKLMQRASAPDMLTLIATWTGSAAVDDKVDLDGSSVTRYLKLGVQAQPRQRL